jgi:hypothetical protein
MDEAAQSVLRTLCLKLQELPVQSEQGRPSFLKKRSKRLLRRCRGPLRQRIPGDKSFLVVFFKKELLALPLNSRSQKDFSSAADFKEDTSRRACCPSIGGTWDEVSRAGFAVRRFCVALSTTLHFHAASQCGLPRAGRFAPRSNLQQIKNDMRWEFVIVS